MRIELLKALKSLLMLLILRNKMHTQKEKEKTFRYCFILFLYLTVSNCARQVVGSHLLNGNRTKDFMSNF